ncbi:TPA: hypothetical protein ACN37W_003761 [Vibrio parahaemolyticus]
MTGDVRLTLTEKRLREALMRLVSNKPTNRELKRKLRDGKLKINVSNVEKEAGLANGAAKRYPETRELIKNAEAERIYGPSDVPESVIRTQPLYLKVHKDLVKAKDEIQRLKQALGSQDETLSIYKKQIKELVVKMHQINVAMWDQIPDENKSVNLIKNVQNISDQNVTAFKK